MIVPTADRSKASVLVKVAFLDRDPRVLPEMSAKAAFLSREVLEAEQKPVKAVPSSALRTEAGEIIAFMVEADRVRRVSVEKGRSMGDMTEVIRGLNVGERVLLDPPENIRDGARVSVPEA
jgi:multidrug efflux pump subunit AcrA (membrane-fusion protein)